MASNPFDDTRDYGTVSGQSSGFKSDEFSRLQQRVAGSVQEIKRLSHSLQRLGQQVGTASDSEDLRRRVHTVQRSAVEHIQSTQAGLKELLGSASNPEQQLSAKSLVRQLKQAGDECSVAMETLRDRLDKFQAPPTPADPASAGYLDSGEVNVEDDRARLLRSPAKEQAMQQEFAVSSEAVETETRAAAMQDLQGDMVDLHEVMQELGALVQSQGETVDNLEVNVEKASAEVTHGNQQLGQAVVYKKCSRKLCCVIWTILIIVFLIIVAIIAIVAAVLSKNGKNK